jgi:hypothetical protein
MSSISTVVDLNLAFNHIKSLSVAMEMQQWLPFAVLESYKIFRTAVINTKVITYFFMQNYLFFPI